MAIKPKPRPLNLNAEPVPPRVRSRAPVVLSSPAQPVMATFAVNIDIADPDRLYAVTVVIGQARGMTEDEVDNRVCVNGRVDPGECITLLLEESITALSVATGVEVGTMETYLEFPSPPAITGDVT